MSRIRIRDLKKQTGSSAIFALSLTAVCIFVLLAIFDLCCVYITREEAKTVAESTALAVSQELLFFNTVGIESLAEDMAKKSGCRLSGLSVAYDEVMVSVEKETNIAVLEKIGWENLKTVCSSSSVKITYPWDRKLGLCDYYRFTY